MPTLVYVDSSPAAPEIVSNIASGNVTNGKRKILDDDQNEKSSIERHRKEGETMIQSAVYFEQLLATRRTRQCWPCDESNSDNRKVPKMCQMLECSNQAYTTSRGLCRRHDPRCKKCKEDNCNNQVYRRGFCKRHDPKGNKKCKEDNCNNLVHARGFCQRHDSKYKKCKEDNCNNRVHARGLCRNHDPKYNKKCKEDNCNNQVYARGRCEKHDKLYREKEKRHSLVVI